MSENAVSNQEKYIVTVDPSTRAVAKVERLGESGELSEVPADTLCVGSPTPSPQSYVVNIYIGGSPTGSLRVASTSEDEGVEARVAAIPGIGGNRLRAE